MRVLVYSIPAVTHLDGSPQNAGEKKSKGEGSQDPGFQDFASRTISQQLASLRV